MVGYRPSDTPIDGGKMMDDIGELVENEKYQKLVRRLIYLSNTKPDIAL